MKVYWRGEGTWYMETKGYVCIKVGNDGDIQGGHRIERLFDGMAAALEQLPLMARGPTRHATYRILPAAAAILASSLAVMLVYSAVRTSPSGPGVSLAQAQGSPIFLQPVPMQAMQGKGGQAPTLYYVPVNAMPAGSRMVKGAQARVAKAVQQQPVVYYYMPQQMLAGDNATSAANATAAQPSFVCTVQNIVALHAEVQPKWDQCKTNPNYVEPNKDAKRSVIDECNRLLEWVWEPQAGEQKTVKPQHRPSYYRMHLEEGARRMYHKITSMRAKTQHRAAALHRSFPSLAAGNATNASTAAAPSGPTLSECEIKAVGEACAKISSCANPVCSSYYNEPEIEALCGMCGMAAAGWGCFAQDSVVSMADGSAKLLKEVSVGETVMSASSEGNIVESRVIFVHDHKEASATVRISHDEDTMELTTEHMVPMHTEVCGKSYCDDAELIAAKNVKVGDKIYIAKDYTSHVVTVKAVSRAISMVRYVLTENDSIVINGVVASVYSTAAKTLETLPFRMVDKLVKGVLQWGPVASSLGVILESPALRNFEFALNTLVNLPSVTAGKTNPLAHINHLSQ
eukprot:756605-Hanusia_phi.AAC.6